MLLTQIKKKGYMKMFWCFYQKPPLLYNYVFTELVPFPKYCHIFYYAYHDIFRDISQLLFNTLATMHAQFSRVKDKLVPITRRASSFLVFFV